LVATVGADDVVDERGPIGDLPWGRYRHSDRAHAHVRNLTGPAKSSHAFESSRRDQMKKVLAPGYGG
jgi:hypothetical protein